MLLYLLRNSTYKEKTIVQSPYISIIGEDSEKTIWTYDAANGTINPETNKPYGTGGSASVTIKSKAVGFTAENITIANDFKELGNNNEQAVALSNEADQSMFINCRFLGNQDTLLANASGSSPARQYYYRSYIEGDVDFIFGRAQAVFDNCDIVSLNRGSNTNNGYVTAASTWDKDSLGYLIVNSRLLGVEGIASSSVSLGRPWRPNEGITPSVTYINNYMGDHITSKGWDDMGSSLASTSRFNEFANYGPGAKVSETRNILSIEEAANYTMNNIFAADSATIDSGNAFTFDWVPTSVEAKVNIETLYGTAIPVTSVTLDKNKGSLKIGETMTITAVVGPEEATDREVVFTSSDENVATVDQNGVITAISVGTATITVISGGISVTCEVKVLPSLTVMNAAPELNIKDVSLKVGDDFNVMEAVTATDKEDGDITSSIEVIENTVDTAVAGEYKVVYKVTDSQGASATKEIRVTVNPANEIVDDSNNGNDNNAGNDDKNDGVGDSNNGSTEGPSKPADDNSNNLPNTGGTSSVVIGSIAVLLIIAGVVLSRKKVRK